MRETEREREREKTPGAHTEVGGVEQIAKNTFLVMFVVLEMWCSEVVR